MWKVGRARWPVGRVPVLGELGSQQEHGVTQVWQGGGFWAGEDRGALDSTLDLTDSQAKVFPLRASLERCCVLAFSWDC